MATSTEPLVVLGIVRNIHNRVLLVRRRDESRWIFPGGQNEPGEAEADTVVREVLEETGVQCKALYSIGRRMHPESNRELEYWVCSPLSDSITVGDFNEVADAQWVGVTEALNLLGSGIYEPVRKILTSSS